MVESIMATSDLPFVFETMFSATVCKISFSNCDSSKPCVPILADIPSNNHQKVCFHCDNCFNLFFTVTNVQIKRDQPQIFVP